MTRINRERLVQNFLKLVQIDALTRQEAAMAEELIRQLAAIGIEAGQDDAGKKIGGNAGNVIANIPGTVDKPAIMLCAHMDRVTPGAGVKPQIKDGIITSDGTTILAADDLAGVTAIIEALTALKESGLDHGPIDVVFTVAEEGGLFGAKNLDYSRISARMGFVFDSDGPANHIVVQGPAQDRIEAEITGKAAHAGAAPEEGINAIAAASRGLARMKLGRIDHETTANIGIIKGGTATNIVPDKVELVGEARSLRDDKLDAQSQHMKECLEQGAKELGATAKVTVSRLYSAFNLAKDDPVVQIATKAVRRLGYEPVLKSTGGGSDANIFNGAGIPSVNFGLNLKKVHTTEEHIAIDDLAGAAEMILAIIESV